MVYCPSFIQHIHAESCQYIIKTVSLCAVLVDMHRVMTYCEVFFGYCGTLVLYINNTMMYTSTRFWFRIMCNSKSNMSRFRS